jgi:hypothetical protein
MPTDHLVPQSSRADDRLPLGVLVQAYWFPLGLSLSALAVVGGFSGFLPLALCAGLVAGAFGIFIWSISGVSYYPGDPRKFIDQYQRNNLGQTGSSADELSAGQAAESSREKDWDAHWINPQARVKVSDRQERGVEIRLVVHSLIQERKLFKGRDIHTMIQAKEYTEELREKARTINQEAYEEWVEDQEANQELMVFVQSEVPLCNHK